MEKLSDEIAKKYSAILVLEDGSYFLGHKVGSSGETIGEICFNTSLTGYQEIITDPSYAGQIICFTFPHIGNVGVNDEDNEAKSINAKGIIIRENITAPSNYRSENHLKYWMEKNSITGICGVDTRAITRKIRLEGAKSAIIFAGNLINIDIQSLATKARNRGDLKGVDLAKVVSTKDKYNWNEGIWQQNGDKKASTSKFKVVAIDYGEKLNILRCLVDAGCSVTVVPAEMSGDEILKMNPDGIFLSNGPADPAATVSYTIPTISTLINSGKPVFGICLGHQLMALALGAKTSKMHQGHRGGNHPVKNLLTGRVEITSQNHGFEVLKETLPANAKVTHISLFDGSLEGFKLTDKPVFAVQYHPEASPGPHDSKYLFDQFVELMNNYKNNKQEASAA